jgi:hypothetical protein
VININLQKIKELINEPYYPNPTEWAKNVEKVLKENDAYSEEYENAVRGTIHFNGSEEKYRDLLIYALKELLPDSDENIVD